MQRTDRLRVERVVWTVDLHVQSLPGRVRKDVRREMRANLLAAAAEVGLAEALRRLGSPRAVARGYLDAEYGEGGLRPEWGKACFWALAAELGLFALLFVGQASFESGLTTAAPAVTGTFTWDDLAWLGVSVEYTYVGGQFKAFSGMFSAWVLLYPAVAVVLGGRLWRMLPAWWRSRRRPRTVGTL